MSRELQVKLTRGRIIALVAGLLEVSKAAVSLKSGQTSRRKVVEVQVGGLSAEAIRAALAAG